jgi:heat shock protein HslJ
VQRPLSFAGKAICAGVTDLSRRHLILGGILLTAAAANSSARIAAQDLHDAPAGVTETQWNLTEVDGAAVTVSAPDSQPYIYLQEPGDRLSGSGGCNRLFGSFDLSGSSLQFHSVASTRMACAGNISEHEAALLEALKLTTGFQISGNLLQLKVDDRVLARFQARRKKSTND